MSKDKKPVHTVTVRIKVFADTKEEAEKAVSNLMRTGMESTYVYATEDGDAIKHWQIKQ